MIVKYVRWSTASQTGARQLMDRDKYDLVLQDQVSGAVKLADRPEGKKLLAMVMAGTVTHLHVEELTRLGRNAHDIIDTLATCKEHGVNVTILNMGLSSIVNGKPNNVFQIVTYLLSALSEQERETIKERTEAGKMAARIKGVKFGRPTGSNEREKDFMNKDVNKKIAIQLKKGVMTIRQIGKVCDASPTTVKKVKDLLVKRNELEVA